MLGKVDFSLTYAHLSDFILGRGYTDYFNLQQTIAELTEAGLIHQETLRSTTYYMITPEGEETIGYFSSRISLAIRADIDAWLRENRLAMIGIVAVVTLLFAVLIIEGLRLNRRIDENEAHRQTLEEEIASEEMRTESIESLREYMQSDEYLKQAAKDRLGLVESDEVIFRPQD
jgi:cell division protein FtsB